ncbi:hypothetical protein LAZ67_17001679 [Cordylochernes scorpioides]|uniref:Uncharacterized protein n=1 Tax=Cordylochernes scorpioides TaxID=51811 RepID=A0ABY6LDI4_9ARAC|nr:hypothetical protein LAZ67_17001679 [Cordylochernes scorpioides]
MESKKAMKAIPKTDYQRCFANWKKRWLKCIAANGDYFEGDNLNLIQPVFININLPENPCSEFWTLLKIAYFQLVKTLNFAKETKLNQNLRFNIKGYTTLRKERPGKFGGGLAVLNKTLEIKFKEIAYNQSSLEKARQKLRQ